MEKIPPITIGDTPKMRRRVSIPEVTVSENSERFLLSVAYFSEASIFFSVNSSFAIGWIDLKEESLSFNPVPRVFLHESPEETADERNVPIRNTIACQDDVSR